MEQRKLDPQQEKAAAADDTLPCAASNDGALVAASGSQPSVGEKPEDPPPPPRPRGAGAAARPAEPVLTAAVARGLAANDVLFDDGHSHVRISPSCGSPPRGCSIAIIGAGPAGLAALGALGDAAEAAVSGLTVYVFDDARPADRGAGQAWRRVGGVADKLLISNMWAPSLVYGDHTRTIARAIDEQTGRYTADFPPRAQVGDVLRRWALEMVERGLRRGLDIRFVGCRVHHLEVSGNGRLELRAGVEGVPVDAAILTVGNEASAQYKEKFADCPGYIADLWAPEGLASIQKYARVAIIGTSLSGVDGTLWLGASGHQGPIELFSRSGVIAGVRPLHVPATLKTLQPGTIAEIARRRMGGKPLDLSTLTQLVREEFEAQEVSPRELLDRIEASKLPPKQWLRSEVRRNGEQSETFGVMKALDDAIPELWNELSLDEQALVLYGNGEERYKHLFSHFAAVQWPMASPNGVKLLQMVEAGQVAISQMAGIVKVAGRGFEVQRTDGTTFFADNLVDVTGFCGKLDQFRDPLIRSLREQGLAVAHPLLGARVDFQTGRLVNEFGIPTAPIWAGASAFTRGSRLLTNELGEATRSAVRATRAALQHLQAHELLRTAD